MSKKIDLYSKSPNHLTYELQSEIVYSRSDYDGYKWWTTWHNRYKEKPVSELVTEIDSFQSALFELPGFKTLDTMRQLCESAETTSDPTEYNLYSETEHLSIWLRLVTRYRDYNLYVHYYLKQDTAVYAMQLLQSEMAGEAEHTGLVSDDDVITLVNELRNTSES